MEVYPTIMLLLSMFDYQEGAGEQFSFHIYFRQRKGYVVNRKFPFSFIFMRKYLNGVHSCVSNSNGMRHSND